MSDVKKDRERMMSFFDHLRELRKRILISIASIGVGAVIGYIVAPFYIDWIQQFYIEASRQEGVRLTQTTILDGFMLRIKVATYGGIVIAAPVWLWQLWRFITPGLKAKEKRYAIPFIIASLFLFFLGGAVSLFTLTKALEFLLVSGGVDYNQVISASSYVTFVMLMFIAFGLSFEFPVVLVFLLIARVITTKQLKSVRRAVILTIVIFAAIITPSQDPITLFFMAAPMYLFYEMSIIIGKVLKR